MKFSASKWYIVQVWTKWIRRLMCFVKFCKATFREEALCTAVASGVRKEGDGWSRTKCSQIQFWLLRNQNDSREIAGISSCRLNAVSICQAVSAGITFIDEEEEKKTKKNKTSSISEDTVSNIPRAYTEFWFVQEQHQCNSCFHVYVRLSEEPCVSFLACWKMKLLKLHISFML